MSHGWYNCEICGAYYHEAEGDDCPHGRKPATTPEGMSETPLTCFDCPLVYGSPGWADFIVLDEVWRQISPSGGKGGILCVTCMIRRMENIGLHSIGRFSSGPFADHTLDYTTKKTIERLERELAEAKREAEEQARLNGMGAQREAALMGKVERMEREREGWKLVPVEPTEEMQRAGFHANVWRNEKPCGPHCVGRITMPADKAYRAMLAACPEDPT